MSSVSVSRNADAYLCELIDLDMIVIILRSSVKEIQDDIAIIQYNGRPQKAKILFRGSFPSSIFVRRKRVFS